MIRYALDQLGWYSFESLIQSLLKSELGPGIESWGESGDMGRDAYSEGPLAYPDRNHLESGPFIFQIKFVSGANAAGSNFRPAIMGAVRSELTRIEKHKKIGIWIEPRYYILYTNARLSPKLKDEIKSLFTNILPASRVFLHNGKDVCDLLDNNPNIRQSFPQILGLRDLDKLISESVHSNIIQRSRSAIEEAHKLASLFVPTIAYYKALSTLKRHYFVVLDGPPEMGKTAIARILSLVYSFNGFQVIECRDSNDIFALFKPTAKQIFIADDAFGRTEYNIARGRLWEQDLPQVLNKINENHLLVWTSRKHILQFALNEMDLSGRSRRFPEPSEVLVDASALTIEEKARILYRHGRNANLEKDERMAVKELARHISTNENFTPERIRRLFTNEYNIDWQNLDVKITREIVSHSLANPTDHMSKSFKALSDNHKWLLITILEIDSRYTRADIILEHLCKRTGNITQNTFDVILNDLDGTFIRVNEAKDETPRIVDWIHPSYRDLLIEVLQVNYDLQKLFLQTTTVAGISLALSVSGSNYGERVLPFAQGEDSFEIIHKRCLEIMREAPNSDNSRLLFNVLKTAAMHEELPKDKKERIKSLQIDMARLFIELCRDGTVPLVSILESISEIHILYPYDIPLVPIMPTLEKIITGLLKDANYITEGVLNYSDISFYSLGRINGIIEALPYDHPQKDEVEVKLCALFDEISQPLSDSISDVEVTGDKEADEQELSELEYIKRQLETFNEKIDNQEIKGLIATIDWEVSNLEEAIPPDPEEYQEIHGSEMGGFSVEALFSDF